MTRIIIVRDEECVVSEEQIRAAFETFLVAVQINIADSYTVLGKTEQDSTDAFERAFDLTYSTRRFMRETKDICVGLVRGEVEFDNEKIVADVVCVMYTSEKEPHQIVLIENEEERCVTRSYGGMATTLFYAPCPVNNLAWLVCTQPL